jgi:hypothetical protein
MNTVDSRGIATRIPAPLATKTMRNGTWTMDASGIQCAFEGIGRVGSGGMTPPTSAKIQMKSTLNP